MRILPPTPFLDNLTRTIGSVEVDRLYFDENGDVKDDAPEELKREIELLRDETWDPDEGVDLDE